MTYPAADHKQLVEARRVLREVLPVARLALADYHPMPSAAEIEALLALALVVVDRAMPPELQAQDKRVVAGICCG
jgi:hypothetical protein